MSTEFPPPYWKVYWVVAETYRELGGSADNAQLEDKVTERLDLSEEQVGLLHKAGPRTEILFRINWMRTHLKETGMLSNPRRGVWALTKVGLENLAEADKWSDQEKSRAYKDARAIYQRNLNQRRKVGVLPSGGDVGARLISDGDLETKDEGEDEDEDWKRDLLGVVQKMEPEAFERLARRFLLQIGFSRVEVVGGRGDGGIDVIGVVKINDVLSVHVLAQCKRYKGVVGPSAVRDFRGAMQGRTENGVMITSGQFSVEARKEATRDGVPTIELVDGEALAEKLKELGMGVKTEMVERVIVDSEYFMNI